MRFYPKLRRKKRLKGRQPVLIDIDKLAKREDVEAIAKKLQDGERIRLRQRIARLSPRQKRKLVKMIAERKGAKNEKKG